jgi:glycosyltransferase involved in cell wall biosynthesis
MVVPSGVEIPEDVTPCRGVHSDLGVDANGTKRIFLCLCRLRAAKGLDLLLDAWARSGEKLDDSELWIAGKDLDGTGHMLRRRASRLRYSHVKILGAVSEEEKQWLLRAANVFVLPSRGEGQSPAILEAMALGRPALITETCFFPEAERAGAALQCSLDVAGISRGLSLFASLSHAQVDDMGRKARGLVSERFRIDEVARELDLKTRKLTEDARLEGED